MILKSDFFSYLKKNFWEKNIFRPTGGCSPPGGMQGGGVVPHGWLQGGGVGGGKKKFPKKSQKLFFFGPNRVIIPLVHDFKKMIFLKSKKLFLRKKNLRPTGGGV